MGCEVPAGAGTTAYFYLVFATPNRCLAVAMVKITERCFEVTGRPAFICDFSPPRSGQPGLSTELSAESLPAADFILAAYNPGRTVRVSSALLAAYLRRELGRETAFALATRDMNRLALQSQLLGAQLLGLENVVVVQGDPFSERDLERVRPVADYRPTQLIAAIASMNRGRDFRDRQLPTPTDFCIGATADLGRGLRREARLAARKVASGAQFLITQPSFDPTAATRFGEAYAEAAGAGLSIPVFYGLQLLERDGIAFGEVPAADRQALEAGRPGVELAVELYGRFREVGIGNIYLLPPIRRGGSRNYAAAQEFLEAVRGEPLQL